MTGFLCRFYITPYKMKSQNLNGTQSGCLLSKWWCKKKKKRGSPKEVDQYTQSEQQNLRNAGPGSHGPPQHGASRLCERNHRRNNRRGQRQSVSVRFCARSFLPPHFGFLDRPEVRVVDHVVLAGLCGGNAAAGGKHGVLLVSSRIVLSGGAKDKQWDHISGFRSFCESFHTTCLHLRLSFSASWVRNRNPYLF